MCVLSRSVVSDSANPRTIARQAPLSMGCFWQEDWSGLPFLILQGNFLTQGSNPPLLHWQSDSSPLSHLGSPRREEEPINR